MRFFRVLRGALDLALERVVKAQDAGHIAAAIAVVWC